MFTFSSAAESDYPAMVDVMEDVGYLSFAYPGLDKAEVIKRISSSRHHYFLAYDDSIGHKREVVGYYVVGDLGDELKSAPIRPLPHSAYSFGIGVRKDYRKRGVAEGLKKHVDAEAKAFGYAALYTDVDSANEESLRLQKKAKFEEVAQYRDPKRARQSGINVVFRKKFS